MELLLQQDRKFCSACRTRRLFRISRYGCGYACLCSFLGIATVVRDFVSLRGDVLAYSDISWLPMISSSSSFGTSCISVVSVELDCCQGELHVTANNLDSCSLQDVLEALPDVLRSQSRLDTTAFRLPSGLLDELMDSLGSFCAARPGHVFLNGPFPEAIKAWDNKTAPASDDKILQAIPLVLYQTLWMHQLCAIKEVIGFGGRALIADDMGVGKTMEALGAISILRCYPLLIVCPSALKHMWADHIEKYLHGQVSIDDMHIIAGSNDAMSHDASPKVVIISYHMVSALADDLRRREWSGLLCDESHILHTNVNGTDAVYTRILLDIGKQASNCLLLSGTPALSSPFDMFNQIEMLTRGSVIGKSPWEMALRYTHIHFSPYVKVMECVRPIELNSLLRQTCMIRRLKSEVLELPGKRRVVLRIAGGASEDESASFQSRYANLWKHRIGGILEAVDLMSEKYPCFVLFAHHQLLLDRLEVHVQQRKLTYIRIDGTTCPKSRGKILADFTAKKSRVALIGITACAVGISLAAASCAVFCELPPDAGWMRQAEDRLHRVGQPNSVVVYYLLAVYSATEGRHFSRLLSAVSDVDNVLDGPTKSSISFHYSAHRTNTSGSRPAALGMAATRHHCFPSHTYHVAVSKHTGRIHVKEEGGNYYESFSLDEAYESVRLRQSPCWRELETSLVEWEQLSPFQRRQLIAAGTWRTIKSPWAACATQITGTCTSRYPSSIAIGWGCWYVVRRARGPPTYYFGSFALKGVPLCLHCHVAMGRTDIEVFPGRLRPLNSDTVMFCCGKCREQYFVQRSSSSIRRSLEAVDGGICSNCHVDCQQLCRLTMALTSIKERMLLVKRVHPQLVEFPVLCRNFVRHPTSGNCWHADHVVPVAQGGGGATIDNLQTLCVACHAVKTREDVVAITTARHSRRRTEDATPTKEFISSADRAVASLLGGRRRRVSSHKCNTNHSPNDSDC